MEITPFSLHDLDELTAAATADSHGVAAPSHTVRKDGKIVGYLSIGIVPTVWFWLDSKAVKVRDTISVVSFYEEEVVRHGFPGFLLPVPTSSPLQPYTEKAGYQPISPNTMIYFKPTPPTKGGS